jgi:hypothetical protein
MKKHVLIAIIAGFVVSCTNDSAEEFLPQNKNIETTDFSDMEKEGDITATNSTSDTGGQGGSTPIKPPRP